MRSSSVFLVIGVVAAAACGRPAPPPASPAAAAAKAGLATPAPKDSGAAPAFAAGTIDVALRDAWKANALVAAPRCDDATFIRRAYVDVAGTIPTPAAVSAFLADPAPDKRQKLVASLIDSPAYAEHWMNYWDDVLMGHDMKGGQQVDRVAFRYWLHARFEANAPWDRMVRDLVSATGQNSIGGARVNLPKALAMQVPIGTPDAKRDEGVEGAADLDKVNGAVNFSLRFEQQPQDLAGTASRVFLGVQIQCAQCHDHKTEKWKQTDFRSFASAFLHQRVDFVDKRAMGVQRRIEVLDLDRVAPRFAKNPELAPIAASKATALDGTDLEKGKDTRRALAAWMTSKENPWFAKAIVNRMWGHFLGRGFYDPVDDIRPSNPATMPELLDKMAADFAAHDFDLQYLIREITDTEAYNLAASASAKVDPENKLWARFHLVPLGPEELMNALLRATNVENAAEHAGIKNLDGVRLQLVRQYAFLFDTDEDDDVPDYSGTVSQALALLNGQLVGQGARAIPGGAVDEVLASRGTDDAAKIDLLAMRILSRHATADEKARLANYVEVATKAPRATIPPPKKGGGGAGPLARLREREGDPRRLAFEDVAWAFLNSSEFVFNH